jgi:amino acid transporter
MWPGLVLALGVAFITALSFAELARRYPEAGGRGSYYFAEKIFLDQQRLAHPGWVRAAKFVTGWAAHLFYWVYPGVLTAFGTLLVTYILQQLGMEVLGPGKVMLTIILAVLVGLLAGRGITGSTTLAVGINLVQVVALIVFGVLVIAFRWINPLHVTEWVHTSALAVITPHTISGTLFQGALAILILAGFESSTTLAAEALNPKRDVPRGMILSLLIQGVFTYLLGYFAVNFVFNSKLTTETFSGFAAITDNIAPLSVIARQVGDSLLWGNGEALALVLALTGSLALLGATLAALNMGVRLSFAMAQDSDMPEWLGALHADFATPYVAVWIMVGVSAVIGALGALNITILTGLILAANIGVFLLYALICGLTLLAFRGQKDFHWLKHGLIPALGVVGNLGLLAALIGIGLTSGGITTTATYIALGVAGVWGAISVAYFARRWPAKQNTALPPL